MRLEELRQRVGAGEYEIDTTAVADALLRRRPVKDPARRHVPRR